jgi:predicted RNA binding protein YcfA (HicA-like mRNA interferase family)
VKRARSNRTKAQLKTVALSLLIVYLASEKLCGKQGGMSRRDKLVALFKGRPKDFTWDEMVRLLEGLGYVEAATGKTGGSRRRFVHKTAPTITLHKPHPGNVVKMYVIDDVLRLLNEEGLI